MEKSPEQSSMPSLVARILAEELTAFEFNLDGVPRRIKPEDLESGRSLNPAEIVLDALEEHMGFDASHDYAMRPLNEFDGQNLADVVEAGRVGDVLRHIDATFGIAAA